MLFGLGKKIDVEVSLDRDRYRPGDRIRITALVHGEEPDGLEGGDALLRCRVERRHLEREGVELAEGNLLELIPSEKREAELNDLRTKLTPAEAGIDGAPRLEGELSLPDDAPPSMSGDAASVEWQLLVFVKRKGSDRAERLSLQVSPARA